jgi:uncharacterized membrane protein YphA (DoxX/SURF4 family)
MPNWQRGEAMKLTAGTTIKCDLHTLWERTQAPHDHVRWDLRFSNISYLPKCDPKEPQRFRYTTRIGFGKEIAGWGETVAQRDGSGSALRFGSEDNLSLIREGSGCWIYKPKDERIVFETVYDYGVRYGRLGRILDRIAFRPLMIWATRWSFDRLRLWIESGVAPELGRRLWTIKVTARIALGLIWILEGLLPKILMIAPDEIDLVRRSGIFWDSPANTLKALGVIQIMAGLWLLCGRVERLSVSIATLVMGILSALVLFTKPMVWFDPLGGIVKNLALIAAAVTVYYLAPITPKAIRANRRRR